MPQLKFVEYSRMTWLSGDAADRAWRPISRQNA